ncbi:MAG TPA: competence/damage-inducible protein A [Thermoanaerobaculia bacterium]|nr:competence/damage-inducible protein A [Thermoanaerobaculia bacterium]
MKAAVVAVGTELLGVDRLDTNSLHLTRILESFGVELRRKAVVGDDEEEVAKEVARLAEEFDLLLVSGGLGPTADDVTREAVARAFGRGLILDPTALDELEARFRRFGIAMPAPNRKQAERVEGATLLHNAHGTAPGQLLCSGGCAIFLLPGVPRELEKLAETALVPWLRERWDGTGIERRVLKVACVPESGVEERITPAYAEFGREAITVLARPAEIHVWASAAGDEETRGRRLERMQRRLRELIGDTVFAEREEETLESVVGGLLATRGGTLAVGESCTGGLVAERLTRVPGSSAWFLGGAVAYSNPAKTALLGVPGELLAREGAVSEATAGALARGARQRFDASWGIGVTGIAGPGGGSEAKPVGTVHIAVTSENGSLVHRRAVYPGDRERVRWLSSQWALDMLRRRLLGLEARA